MLEAQLSASLRQSLIEQMATIKSEDEAAAWAHKNLSAKKTLTAADAKMVEEQIPNPRWDMCRSDGSRRDG
jgi:hypothetical protein